VAQVVEGHQGHQQPRPALIIRKRVRNAQRGHEPQGTHLDGEGIRREVHHGAVHHLHTGVGRQPARAPRDHQGHGPVGRRQECGPGHPGRAADIRTCGQAAVRH